MAADYPLLHCLVFQTVTLTVSSYVVVQNTLGTSSNSPSGNLIRCQIRRPFSTITVGVVILLEAFVELELTLIVPLVKGYCS